MGNSGSSSSMMTSMEAYTRREVFRVGEEEYALTLHEVDILLHIFGILGLSPLVLRLRDGKVFQANVQADGRNVVVLRDVNYDEKTLSDLLCKHANKVFTIFVKADPTKVDVLAFLPVHVVYAQTMTNVLQGFGFYFDAILRGPKVNIVYEYDLFQFTWARLRVEVFEMVQRVQKNCSRLLGVNEQSGELVETPVYAV